MMTYKPPSHHRRSAFTLVEMLVSTALIIFVMVILTQVFAYGLQSLRNLRGVGDMQERLRQATIIMRRDLASPHFGRESSPVNGPYLSQQRLDLYDWTPPKEGFFRIYQGSNSTVEGYDGDSIPSFRATDHALHFTVRMDMGSGQGTGRDRMFKTSQIPAAWMNGLSFGGQSYLPPSEMSYLVQDEDYCSRWAEIAYFLEESGQQVKGNTRLYTLYRRRRVALDCRTENKKDFNLTNVNAVPLNQQNPLYAGWRPDPPIVPPGDPSQISGELRPEVSFFRHPTFTMPNNSNERRYYFNTPADLANPARRFMNSDAYYSGRAMQGAISAQQPGGAAVTPNIPPLPFHRALAGLAPAGERQFKSIYTTSTINPANQQSLQQDFGGDDILLENVLSMEIRVNWDSPADSRLQNYFVRSPQTGVNNDEPFDVLPPFATTSLPTAANTVYASANGPAVFDTWCGANNYSYVGATGPSPLNIPLRIRVKAIQIRLRIWDIKTQQARQVTIVQDL